MHQCDWASMEARITSDSASMMAICPRCWSKLPVCGKCRGVGKVPDRQLSANFKLSELVETPKGRAAGIANDPPFEIEVNLERLCKELLEPIRALVGPLKINSGYRSDAVNKAVGGSTTSAHSFGLAADLNPISGTWKSLMDAIIASGLKYDQIIFEHTWVHVGLLQPKTLAQRGQKLAMFRVGDKTTYESYNPKDPRIK